MFIKVEAVIVSTFLVFVEKVNKIKLEIVRSINTEIISVVTLIFLMQDFYNICLNIKCRCFIGICISLGFVLYD